ncbi:MAG: ankyrin repeat protein [Terrestrivirus sp.]|uniref:NAD(+)--protein-arginine ADP-ribosyltransferase n=1 Tax=Terrestrivirus sp. TaxID=2487775 RepID=A0A3G4ZL09_9VIRU|nr:MAG: ankyrin repeat protein [Terrestrivirus sp.]
MTIPIPDIPDIPHIARPDGYEVDDKDSKVDDKIDTDTDSDCNNDSDIDEINYDDLQDPITLDLIEDPIVMPCCGCAIGRGTMITIKQNHATKCPVCNGNITNFDPVSAKKQINLAYILDSIKDKENIKFTKKKHEQNAILVSNGWEAKIRYMPNNNSKYGAVQSTIGRLTIQNPNIKQFKTLLIVAIDKSGSMSNSPIKQVQYSLKRVIDMTYKNPHLITNIVPYDDKASTVFIDRNQSEQYYCNIVDTFSQNMGGTVFRSAFTEIGNVCKTYKDDPLISSIIIVLMTDGQDGSAHQAVQPFKNEIKAITNKDFTVHTIGFGQNHDSKLLNDIRMIGTSEGAYRFADPTEDFDSLSSKINSILDVVMKASIIPLEIKTTDSSALIISGENGKYWVNLTGHMNPIEKKDMMYKISVNGEEEFSIKIDSVEPVGLEEADELENSWYSYLIDEIASELMILSKDTDSSKQISMDKQIHCDLLERRSKSIIVRLKSDSPSVNRLEKLIELINTFKTGGVINQQKLTDMKFEGKFATKSSGIDANSLGIGNKQGSAYQSSYFIQGVSNAGVTPSYKKPWDVYSKSLTRRCRSSYKDKTKTKEFYDMFGLYKKINSNKTKKTYKTDKIIELINDKVNSGNFYDDSDKSKNPLIVASSVGKYKVVEKILSLNEIPINETDKDGFTALDMAKLYGRLSTSKLLEKHGAKSDKNVTRAKGIYDIFGSYKTQKCIEWIDEQVSSGVNFSGESYKDKKRSNPLIVASSIGRYKVVDKLLSLNQINVNETNKDGHTALDMAILHGYCDTVELLVKNGAKSYKDPQTMFRSTLSNKYFRVARYLVKNNMAIITDDMMDDCPVNEAVTWLSANSQKDISIETAISKGIYDIVAEKIDTIDTKETISFKPFVHIFAKPTSEHVRIVDLLMSSNKMDPNEVIDIEDETDHTKEITWPLFIACEKGQQTMFTTLMKYSKDMINFQNNKGTTCLWIASCNKHIDIVSELIFNGADPNIGNFKGDGPLVTACQKGNVTIVEILLEAGANLEVYNKERDNPVLIACRTGQVKILEMFLKTYKTNEDLKKILTQYAEIDGFCPIFACVELDKVEAMKVCHKFGSFDNCLEYRTDNDNKIIAGATPMHLATFYGRTASLKALYELGADIKAKTLVGSNNVLHIAIKQGHINTVRYLLSIPDCIELLDEANDEGRTPKYYSKINGNEAIFEEFFTNKLAVSLEKVLYLDSAPLREACSQILVKYGQSLGTYEYNEITGIDFGQGETLLTKALLNGNNQLAAALMRMNADVTKGDDYGVSPMFWMQFLNSNNHLLTETSQPLNEQTALMLSRVNAVAKSNVQNKMLTNLSAGAPQLLITGNSTENSMNNQLVKMSDGFMMKVKDNVLSSLRSEGKIEQSLLGFIDRLKNNKVFDHNQNQHADSRQQLEHILWESKVNLVKILASEGDVLPNGSRLQPRHIIALNLYTGNFAIFQQVNKVLNNWNSKEADIWKPFIGSLYQAIDVMPPYEGEVYRAVDMQFDPVNYAVGNVISWNTFSMGSTEYSSATELINNKRGMVFVIKSKTGRKISKYSINPVDNEVIFLAGVKFKVVSHHIASIICLAQSNIRNTTFAMKENDLQKVLNGQQSIVIELEEIEVDTKQNGKANKIEKQTKMIEIE